MIGRVMRCAAVSHYFHRLEGAFPPIDARLAAVTRERYRRIDRFVQLALMGASECARKHQLAPDCGLYLSSGVGPITSNVLVQEAIHRDSRMPMPFSFVNTLGSSACYHVAKELDLLGEAVLVARGSASFFCSVDVRACRPRKRSCFPGAGWCRRGMCAAGRTASCVVTFGKRRRRCRGHALDSVGA